MSTADDFCRKPPHIAFFPSAGMGHLTPFLRLAAMLASRNCTVTLITVKPTVSAAESANISAFFSAHPHINRLEFEIPPIDSTIEDPFFKQFEAINRSIHLFKPLLSSFSPPLSAIFSDFALATSVGSITDDLCIPNYVFGITSARFFSLMASLPSLISDNSAKLEIPGFDPSNIPLLMFNRNHFFTLGILSNAPFLPKAKGMLLNTFDEFESETIAAFNNGRVLSCLPPLHPIGPLEPYELEKGPRLPWLDNQIVGSVVYIGFGNKTALSKDQIRELGNGLEISGCPFLWVLKTKKVDTDDNEELQEVLEESFLERTKNKGIVVKEWVKQEEILAHPAIGGFVSHCGWNSVMDASRHGVPVLAWPHGGDQKVTAEVVERAGLAVWVREWGWGGERLVRGEEIGEKVREMMTDRELRNRAREIGEEARKAWEVNGSSEKALMGLIDELRA